MVVGIGVGVEAGAVVGETVIIGLGFKVGKTEVTTEGVGTGEGLVRAAPPQPPSKASPTNARSERFMTVMLQHFVVVGSAIPFTVPNHLLKDRFLR